MSTWPVPSALNPNQTFPELTDAQIARLKPYGTIRKMSPGDILFEPNDASVSFFVMLSGAMEIVQPIDGGERPITAHGARHFTGEINMISGQRSLVRGRVTEAGEFLEISGDNLRSIVNRDAELSEIFMRAFILRRVALVTAGFGNLVLLGSRHSADTLRLREFLSRNGQPHTYLDLDYDKGAQAMLDRFDVKVSEIPVIVCSGKTVLKNPSTQQLADCLGMNLNVDPKQLRDVVIVGAGPSGLAAAVYAASEGLDSLVIETEAPGGQAGSSSKIENYLGFPTGVSGQELAARALMQAQKFGARMMIAHKVVELRCGKRPYEVVLDDGNAIAAKTVIIATGAQYNKPPIANLKRFEGQGVYYGATYIESQLCGPDDVIVVGGGNSAGQAAVYMAQPERKVYMLVRSKDLSAMMSRYLIQRITENPHIELHFQTEITALDGNGSLDRVTWVDRSTGEKTTKELRHVFLMTGASPRTEWLQGCVALDDKGFILTGRDLDPVAGNTATKTWPLARGPQMLETSLPGVFAVGDARAGNVKRVASAVGEGAIAVHLVHRVLAEI
ncbi:MAG TPA: FAD-dependent oxidoreductase [Candidatus Koribacter sp.]|jgi:thioredoxin reductase (NADPH)